MSRPCSECGKTGLYIVGEYVFCSDHKYLATKALAVKAKRYEIALREHDYVDSQINAGQYGRRKFLSERFRTCMSCGGPLDEDDKRRCLKCKKSGRSFTGRILRNPRSSE